MTPERLEEAKAAIQGGKAAVELRAAFPDLIFTECSENDVSPRLTPVAEMADVLIYLFTGASGHCLEFTDDLDIANGILIAARDLDD